MNLPGVATLLVALTAPQGGPDQSADIRHQVQEHLRALSPISAEGVRKCERFADSNTESNNAGLRQMYDGSTVVWRWNLGESYEEERDPKGRLETAKLYRDGVTYTYDVEERHVGKERISSRRNDLSPESYFLYLSPVPFRHFLTKAELEQPSPEDVEGARTVLVVPNPVLKDDQKLRVVVGGKPLRILETGWYYRSRKGAEILIERIRYSNWTEVHGQPFPRLHTKEWFGQAEDYAVRTLRLTNIGEELPPDDLMVPSGTTFFDPDRSGESSLVGPVAPARLKEIVTKAAEWTATNEDSRLFVASGVDLEDSMNALVGSIDTPPEVPLHSDSSNECGIHCLAVAMALQLGVDADYSAVRKLRSLSKSGVSVEQIANAATEIGMHTLAVRGEFEDLLDLEVPFVIPVKVKTSDRLPRHFVVAIGSSEGVPVIMSAPDMAFVANTQWLREYWDGSALILSRDPIRTNGWALWGALGLCGSILIGTLLWRRRRIA